MSKLVRNKLLYGVKNIKCDEININEVVYAECELLALCEGIEDVRDVEEKYNTTIYFKDIVDSNLGNYCYLTVVEVECDLDTGDEFLNSHIAIILGVGDYEEEPIIDCVDWNHRIYNKVALCGA